MEVVLPVGIGIGAALAAVGALVLLRAVRSRVEDVLARQPEIERIAAWPVTPATVKRRRHGAVRAMDASSPAKPVTPRRIHRPKTARITEASGPDSPRADVFRLDGFVDADVEGHADGQAAADVPVVEAQNVYGRADGSTDCPSCASSRLRGARFCIRCGRRLA